MGKATPNSISCLLQSSGPTRKVQPLTSKLFLLPNRCKLTDFDAVFYLRPPQIYKSPIPSVRSSRCQSQHFDPLTIFRFSRNLVSICTSKKVTSGHMSQGRSPKVKVTQGDKLVNFGNFFAFSRTPPAFLNL